MPRNALLSLLLSLSILLSGCSRQLPPAPPTVTPSRLAPLTELPTQAPATKESPPSLPPTVTPGEPASVSEILAGLEGLSIDAFFDESYKQWLLRDPETVIALGLAQTYGAGNGRLTNISDAYIRETQALESGLLALLQKYDRAALTPEQALTAEVYAWWLDDRVRGHAFMYNDYPVNQMVYSLHYGLIQFFADLHPLASRQDAQDYIACLSQVKTKIDQALDGLQRREAAGVILPRYLVLQTRSDLQSTALRSARATPFYTALAEKLSTLNDLTAADRELLLEAAEKEINASVLPGFQALVAYFDHLATVADDDAGVWKFPNGEAYYAHALRHHTTTEMTADELHALGLRELDRIHADMRAVFDQLGYPKDAGLAALYSRAAQEGGLLTPQQVIPAAEALVQGAEAKARPAFDLYPKASVAVIAGTGSTGNYYMQPAFDGSRPGFYYVGLWPQPKANLAATVYHETIPGHHLQMALAQELNLPAVRRGMDFNAYLEGWALYAERLAWELDFYKDDPYGNLARLQLEALRAARLVVDTGLHAKKWTRDQAIAFMLENVGQRSESEIDRYIVAPGQAASYYAGYKRLLDLRQKAKDALGDKFDLRAFHNVILGNGVLPLDLLESVVDKDLAARGASEPATSQPTPVVYVAEGKRDWQNYTHREYGFSFYFPPDWTVQEVLGSDNTLSGHALHLAPMAVPTVRLVITFKRTGEDQFIGRTSLGGGDLVERGSVVFAGQAIRRQVLVADGHDMTILYGPGGEVQRDGLAFHFSLDFLGSAPDQSTLSAEIEVVADQIVASFELP